MTYYISIHVQRQLNFGDQFTVSNNILTSLQKGRLPFQNAAMYGHTEVLKLLLKEPGVQVDSLMKVRDYTYDTYTVHVYSRKFSQVHIFAIWLRALHVKYQCMGVYPSFIRVNCSALEKCEILYPTKFPAACMQYYIYVIIMPRGVAARGIR